MAEIVSDGLVQLVFRVADVIDIIAWQSPISLSDITRETGLPKTTVHRLLGSLEQARIVGKTERGYILGSRVDHWQGPVDKYQRLRFAIGDVLAELANATGETASIFVGFRDRRMCWAVQEGDQEVRHVMRPNQCFPLGVGSGGKLLLSILSPSERKRALKATLERFPHVTAPALSDADWDALRDAGVAASIEEREEGLASVSVILKGWPMACISISGPAARFSTARQQLFIQLLRSAANQVEHLVEDYPGGMDH